MFARTKEPPSVVSTRVLRTHRLNEVESFRLQERIRAIDCESHNNYCQISDEIHGVKKNLNRIKKVKKNLGVSVERRKLLREKGYRVLPCRGLGDETITLRGPDGKKISVEGTHCYDGELLRRQLNINFELSQLHLEAEEVEDSSTITGKEEDELKRGKVFQFRIISPPLRPGSRRNFKDIREDENSDNEHEFLLSETAPRTRKTHYRIRSQTAVTRKYRKGKKQRRPRSRPSVPRPLKSDPDGAQHENEIDHISLLEKVKEENSVLILDGKKSEENPLESFENGSSREGRKLHFELPVPSLLETENESKILNMNSNRMRKKSLGDSFSKSVVSFQESATDEQELEESVNMARSKSENGNSKPRGYWRVSLSVEPKLLQRRKSTADENLNVSTDPATSSETHTLQASTINMKDYHTAGNNTNKTDSKLNEEKVTSHRRSLTAPRSKKTARNAGETVRERIPKYPARLLTESFNSLSSNSTGAMGTLRSSPHQSRKGTTGGNHEAFSYDARPDKALTKGYTTMQMTIGGKQVRLCVPKFSTECFDDVVERARAKSAARSVEYRTRGLSTSLENK